MDLAARLRDFFILRTATEEARRRPAERRSALENALQLGRQRAEAAEALWSNGHAAEGLRLIVDALNRTVDAASLLVEEVPAAATPTSAEAEPAEDAAVDDAPSWKDVLRHRGASGDDVANLDRVLGLARRPLPTLDLAVSAADAELYRAVYRARAEIDARVAPASLTLGQVRLRVAQRWTVTLLLVVLAVVLAWLGLRTPREVLPHASAFFRNDPQFSPERAFDDDPNTEWLLNDGENGWIEARLSPPRDLTKVRILNGHNRHFNDRAIKELQVELYDAAGQKVFEHDAEMAFSPTPSWLEIPVSATRVERIRLNVRSHHRVGAALAELSFEER